jgi:zinc protease
MAVDRSRPPGPGPVKPFRFPRLERGQLDNGLATLTARHGDLPLVTAQLVLDAGATSESLGKAGLAHLTASLLETGTETLSADKIAWSLESLGVQFESEAAWDATVLRIVVPRERLAPALSLFADLVRRPSFPGTEFERVRDEQLADILQRRKEPRALGDDMITRFIYNEQSRYARPLIGTSSTVVELTRQDVLQFYGVNYRPSAATLMFVGDIDAATARNLARSHFGDWSVGRATRSDVHVAGAVERSTVFVVDRPGSVQSEIRIGDIGVSRHHEDYFPIVVMNSILGGAFTSRLNMSLREKHGFTYGVRSKFSFRRQPGPFVVQAAVATEVTGRAVEEALREINLLREQGATEDEVASNRDYLAGVLPLELQTTEQLASRLSDLVVFDLPDDDFEHYPERILAVKPEDVHRVAREYLRPGHFAIVVVGDAQTIAPELGQLGVGAVIVHPAE